jgi:3-oxoacyl-(acyl-carrier-protein) synthase
MRLGMIKERVVIAGCGLWTPAGVGLDAFLSCVGQRRSVFAAWGDRAAERRAELESLRAGLINDLTPFRRIFPEIKPPLPAALSQIAMVTAREALLQAGLESETARARVGAIFNRNRGPASIVAKSMLPVLQQGPKKMSPLLFSQAVANAPLGALTTALGLKGPNLLTMGAGAVQIAFDEVAERRSQSMLCGAMEEVEPHSFIAALENGFIGQASEEQPDGIATFGEGAAAFVLESLDCCSQRGARPLAEVVAVEQGLDPAMTEIADLHGWGRVSAQGLAAVCELALQDAGISAGQLDHFAGGANGHPKLEQAQTGALELLGRVELAADNPRLHLLLGDGYGLGLYLNLAWCVARLAALGVSAVEREPSRHPCYALLTHTDFHGQHTAVVLRSIA